MNVVEEKVERVRAGRGANYKGWTPHGGGDIQGTYLILVICRWLKYLQLSAARQTFQASVTDDRASEYEIWLAEQVPLG